MTKNMFCWLSANRPKTYNLVNNHLTVSFSDVFLCPALNISWDLQQVSEIKKYYGPNEEIRLQCKNRSNVLVGSAILRCSAVIETPEEGYMWDTELPKCVGMLNSGFILLWMIHCFRVGCDLLGSVWVWVFRFSFLQLIQLVGIQLI